MPGPIASDASLGFGLDRARRVTEAGHHGGMLPGRRKGIVGMRTDDRGRRVGTPFYGCLPLQLLAAVLSAVHRGEALALHHAHGTVMRSIAATACGQPGFRALPRSPQGSEEGQAEGRQQQNGQDFTQCLDSNTLPSRRQRAGQRADTCLSRGKSSSSASSRRAVLAGGCAVPRNHRRSERSMSAQDAQSKSRRMLPMRQFARLTLGAAVRRLALR